MATVLVRNLPAITAVDDSDLLIVNDGSGDTYTTSNIRIGDFRASITAEDSTFKKDVTIDGDLGVGGTVTSPTFIGNLQGEAETVSTLSGFTTADLLEDPNKVDGNLYFTLNRFNDVLQATPLARHSDVVLTGGAGGDADKARDGDFLLYNGATYRFENVASSAYDQSSEVTDLNSQFSTLNSTVSTIGGTQIAHGGRLDALESDVSINTTSIGITEGAPSLQTQINDLGLTLSNTQSSHQTQTTEAFQAIRDEAVDALAAFEAAGATTENKLNACQTFFNNIAVINVQP